MSTSYSVLIDMFLKKVEKDINFFNYFNLDDYAAMQLANERALGYLDETVGRIMLECQPTVNFDDRNSVTGEFNFDFTAQEKLIVSSLMYEYYLSRDIAYLKIKSTNYTAAEMRVFDPSNARSTFWEMYIGVCEQNKHLIEEYANKDRKTGKFIGIDYATENADSE